MRKHFLILMLLALLPLAGFAQFQLNNYVRSGNYIYQIKDPSDGVNPGKVKLIGIIDGKNPVDAETKVLTLKGKISINVDEEYSVDFYVNDADENAIKKTYSWHGFATDPTIVGDFAGRVEAKSVVIPKEFLKVKANFFYGYTNMNAISFEENSEVTEIESGAFNTTQIKTFDFSNCSKLATLKEGVFVESGTAVNSYVTTITLPKQSEALTDISTAFQRLPNLTKIENLDKSLIYKVVANAFSGDTNLKNLALPSTVKIIANGAFAGSGIENLTIDVTSLNDPVGGFDAADLAAALNTADPADFTNGNYYATAAYNAANVPADYTTLKTLTLKGTLAGTLTAKAFQNCVNLESINMTALTINGGTIGESAFKGCTKLAALNFVNDITEGTIGTEAFAGATGLKTLTFGKLTDVEIAGGATTKGAFYNTTNLNTITFGVSENLNIAAFAFENTASAGSAAAYTLNFGNATNLQIGASAFAGATKLSYVEFKDIEDDATPSVEIGTEAFAGATGLKTLKFGKLTDVEIAGGATTTGAFYNTTNLNSITFGVSENLNIDDFAFENTASTGTAAAYTLNFADANGLVIGTSAFAGAAKLSYVEFKDIENSTIEDDAFVGATRLATVTIGDVTDTQIGAGTAAVFPAVKTVTIGAVKRTTDATSIYAQAFTYDNQSGATLILGKDNAALETVAGAINALIAAGAFDFSQIDGTVGAPFVAPVVTIGEIKTAKTMAIGTLKGNKIAKIVFNGNIAAGALDAMIVTGNTAVDGLTVLTELVFNGEIATGGIAADAFASLPAVMNIKFNGKLAEGAVVAGAFELLKENSQIEYTYNGADIDLTVNPFAKGAFKATAALADTRIIKFAITNEELKAKFMDPVAGLKTDGAFGVYLAYFFVPVVVDNSFKVYPDLANAASTAWARWELGHRVDANVTGSLTAGTNLVIKRVQEIDGTHKAKITIYGTYTDEDDAMETATVYMVPLKAKNGFYHIPGTNKTTLIVKVENNGADFTDASYKVKVNQTGYDAYNSDVCTDVAAAANGSIWPGLVNKELYVANNIMTNQQLIDKQATDAASTDATGVYGYFHAARTAADINIYRTGTKVAEDLYIMSDPSKNKGFRIDMMPITSSNNAYINTGWYYMLLKKYKDLTTSTAAHVVWLDDATEGEITGILTVKDNAKNVAAKSEGIYTLQGVRVSEMQKGNIYIVNGKKYIAK